MFVTAFRALFRKRLVCRSELALRIIAAAIECVALASFLFDQLSIFAQRTFHTDKVLLYVLAIRISAARSEFPVAPMTNH